MIAVVPGAPSQAIPFDQRPHFKVQEVVAASRSGQEGLPQNPQEIRQCPSPNKSQSRQNTMLNPVSPLVMGKEVTPVHPEMALSPDLIHDAVKSLRLIPSKTNYSLGGRLQYFLNNWQLLTQDVFILQIVQGLEIPFLETPVQACFRSPKPSRKNASLIDHEVQEMIKKNGRQGSCSLFRSISEPCPSCPKEGWRTETSNQSEKAESVCGIPTFQNGGNSDLEIPHKERGFHGQTGSERCILRGSHKSSTSQVYPFLLAREDLRIPSPAVWPQGRAPLLYQASEAGICFPQENRSETCRLLRRHDTAESMQTYADTGLVLSEMASGKPGVPNKLEEICLCPHTSNPVLGIS